MCRLANLQKLLILSLLLCQCFFALLPRENCIRVLWLCRNRRWRTLLLLLLNILLHFVVIRPVKRMSEIAGEVSMGKPDVPEYVRQGSDEIASLSQSFNRMRLSLENAMKMLGE